MSVDIDEKLVENALKSKGFRYEGRSDKYTEGSVVLQAEHEIDKKKYAIKMALKNENLRQLTQELNILSKQNLSRQYIVMYNYSWDLTIANLEFRFIQMEFCHSNLFDFVYNNNMGNAQIVKAEGPPRFYQQVALQVFRGLDAIHSFGWIIRDLHPKNILVANPNPQQICDVRVKIADFGHAWEINTMIVAPSSLDGPVLARPPVSTDQGPYQFRAPELAEGDYDYKVDSISAGVLLYFLSCYLENKDHWGNEISALRRGERVVNNLCFQDDKMLVHLICRLTQVDQSNRLSVKQALEKSEDAWRYIQSEEKEFFIRRKGVLTRCWTKDTTHLCNLVKEVQRCIGNEVNSQGLNLNEERTVNEKVEEVCLRCDDDVQCMFEEAGKARKSVVITVSESSHSMFS